MSIKEEARELQDFLTEFRHDLHMHPELSMKEFRTTDKIAEELDAMGVEYKRFNPTGIDVEVKGKTDKPLVVLRADMDALPIQETTGLPYASQTPNVMHACGHDTHATMLLGALKIILKHKEELNGTLRFIFQPGEETGEGGECVLKQGAADNADMCFGIHCAPDYPVGGFGCYTGGALAACTRFTIKIHGDLAHGATPHLSHDAVAAGCQVVNTLQSIVSRRIDPQWPLVLTVGRISGGTAFNICSDYCELEGTTRYFNKELDEMLPKLMLEVAEDVAKSYGCSAELDYSINTRVVYNSPEVTEIAWKSAEKIMDDPSLVLDYPRIMAGDDFGAFGDYAPSAYYFLGAGGNGPGHSGGFRVDDGILHIGAAMYAQVGIDALNKLSQTESK